MNLKKIKAPTLYGNKCKPYKAGAFYLNKIDVYFS